MTYEQGSVWLLLFWWRGPWLLPVWLPTCLVVSGERIARDGAAAERTVLLNP